MIELYIYLEGNTPKEVILGRRHAVDRLLLNGFKITPAEGRRISSFLEAAPCDLGSGLHVVGFPPSVPDRRIVRVVGPGASV